MRGNWGVPAFPLFSRPPPLEPPQGDGNPLPQPQEVAGAG